MRLIDADKIVYAWYTDADGEEHDGVTLESIINKMPTIEQRKTGKWIWWQDTFINEGYVEYIPRCKCSECGREYDSYSSQFMNYCPNCGANMKGETNET